MRHRYGWEIAILVVAAAWGATFVMVQDAVEVVPPMHFIALRFAAASAVLFAVNPRTNLRLGRVEIIGGIFAGLANFGGYAFQTSALQFTTSSNVGFVTGLYVVLTPMIGAAVLRKLPSTASMTGVLLATAGLFLLGDPSGGIGRGEFLAVGCAASFAIQILVVAHYAGRVSVLPFTVVQLVTVAACAGIGILPSGPASGLDRAVVWQAVLFTAVVATALAFLVQTAAQRFVPPTRLAILAATESVFAAIFGAWLAGDRLGRTGLAGGALILAGVAMTALLAPAREEL